MVKGPKNVFKAISDLRRSYGRKKFLRSSLTQNRVFLAIFFKWVCLCVQILFGGVRDPKRAERVIPAWEKLSDLDPIPSCREIPF